MGSSESIVLTVEGIEAEGSVDLKSLINELTQMRKIVNRIDIRLGDGRPTAYPAVTSMSQSSPARIVIESIPRAGRPDMRSAIVLIVAELLRNAAADTIPDDTDPGLLENLDGMTKPIGRSLRSVRVRAGDDEYELGGELRNAVARRLLSIETSFGSIEGRLEKLNVHEDANIFTIYPPVGPGHVNCRFPDHLFESALAAAKRKVLVIGEMLFRKGSNYPHQINVTDMEIFDDPSEIPSFQDLRGIAPNLTNGRPIEAYLEEVRDGWQ